VTPTVRGLGVVDAPALDPDPRVQRLPRLERLVVSAVREALAGQTPPESLGLVFATGYGGLAATEAFLQSVASRGMAFGSATAFHQSVHHSPAGQLSLLLGIRGPVLTISQRELSGEAALRVGLTLLDRVEHVLVVAADEQTPVLEAAYRAFGTVFRAAEGAAAVLLGPGPGPLRVERCELFSHPASARRFAPPARLGPRLADSVATKARNLFVSIAAPTADVERAERAVLGPEVRVLEDQPGATRVGFHPSAGLVRFVLAARHLLTTPGDSACVLHGLALGGGQSITVLRHDP
jgi:Beta-ketoacyl synthase, N-terminal domain